MGDKPPLPPADTLPVDQILQLLAAVTERARGPEGEVIRAFVDDVRAQVHQIAETTEADTEMNAAKKTVALQIERLLESVLATGVAIGKVIEPHQQQIQNAFAGADLSKVGDSLQLIASYMQNPDEETKQRAQSMLADLERTLGPLVGYDPEREDRERRERIRDEVKTSMSKIFANRPMPKLEFKPTTPLPGSKPDPGGDKS
jgi:hypothetical protein